MADIKVVLYLLQHQADSGQCANCNYRKTSNIRHTNFPKLKGFSSRLAVFFSQSIEARCWAENEDVVGDLE